MAEEGSVYELEGLEKQLQSLLSRYSSDVLRADSQPFCSDFCKLVEEYASRWQVPLPQLRILEVALSYFARASAFLASNCDHVLHTLSSLALSVFELLLFFDQKDFHQEPLKHFTVTFQECLLALAKHQNVHLLHVERVVRGDGPWASPALQAILSESSLPQSEVNGCISSELPVFFELRVRYLLSCERAGEAAALAKCCAWHPTAGRHLFFLQVYLMWLSKTSQHDSLRKEVADLNGKDAIHIICSLECEEKDELLLALSKAFLSQQLRRGDMYYLCDLVFVWSKLHSRLKTSKQALLEETHQLMLSATNVNSIFPFIRAILQELGEDGIQFCVELCANALESCLPCDAITKSLIYKTIAGLLSNDLEVCRACALLVFFSERTVDAYKMVYLLYMHPDQEYHVEHSPIRNHIRFETLQVLKKDLYFDPEFWNLIALRTNCLKLMSEKVVEELMEDKWILNYCTKEPALRSSTSRCQKGSKGAKKRHHKQDRHHTDDTGASSNRLKMGKTRLNVDHTVKKKGKNASSEPLRRSFWKLDRLQGNLSVGYGENRRTTRLSEKNPPKRRIRTPKWLLEDSGTLEENNVPPKMKKHGLKHQRHHRSSDGKRSEAGQLKNDAKHKPSVDSHLMAGEKTLNLKPATPPLVILELSLPDNELMGTFNEDTCNRQRGFPQMLFYKPTVKLPAAPQPAKIVHRKEVILRARDAAMFVQHLHCYARRPRGKGNGPNVQGSVSTITRSSAQGSPPKDPQRELGEKPEAKGGIASPTPAVAEVAESQIAEKPLPTQSTRKASQTLASTRELCVKPATEASEAPTLGKAQQAQAIASAREHREQSAVEMKVTIASQTSKVTQFPGFEKVSEAQTLTDASAEVPKTSAVDENRMGFADEIPSASNAVNGSTAGTADLVPTQPRDVLRDGKRQLKSLSSQNPVDQATGDTPEALAAVRNSIPGVDVADVSPKLSKRHVPCENNTRPGESIVTLSKTEVSYTPTGQDGINHMSTLTLVTEMVTELAPEALDLENHKRPAAEDSVFKEATGGSEPKGPHKLRTTSSSEPELGASAVADVHGMKEGSPDISPESPENSDSMESPLESEESKLEYCCTFCNKVFKGSRVVAHAMFHYRKDECMFCGTMFKDDLLAMMHLSDHIEKLKKIKESAGNNAQENGVSETKDIATPKTSAKVKSTNVSSERRSSGRTRKSAVCPKSVSLLDSTPPGSRKLRSNDKPVEGPSLQGKKDYPTKHLNSKYPVHKVNGHMGKKKELDEPTNTLNPKPEQQEISQERTSNVAGNRRLHENQDTEMDSSAASAQMDDEFGAEGRNVGPQEKVSCPADGCAWFNDLSKTRVALLYHALEVHYGEVKPLELAFRVGNSRCSVCMRVLWSFEHFQHHVERHRLSPRHPCPHQGCAARFKSGMEMRRHARRHSPLQAACCLPGCSKLFICLWALNLHEREHYAPKPTKPDKNTEQASDKHSTPVRKKQLDHEPEDKTATSAVNKTVSVKAARKTRGQATHNPPTGKHVKFPPPATEEHRSPLLKESNETKDSHVLKNLSNKDTSAQPTVPNLRIRQTLRKAKVTNATLTAPRSHKVISSLLLRHNIKARHKLKKKQVKVNTKGPKRRGRPPKAKEAVHDENTSDQNNEAVQDKGALQKDQKSEAQLPCPSKAAGTSNVSNRLEEEEASRHVRDVVESEDESKSKRSATKQVKKNHFKQKGASHNTSTDVVTANSLNQSTSAHKAQTVTADKMKTKRLASKGNGSHAASSDSSKSKKPKVTNGKANTEIKKKCPLKDPESASKRAKSAAPQVEDKAAAEGSVDEEGKTRAGNTDLTPNESGNCVPPVPAESLDEMTAPTATSGEKMHKTAAEEKSKKHVPQKRDQKLVKKGRPRKDASKTFATKSQKPTKSKSAHRRAEAKASSPGVEGKAKEETSCSSIPAAAAGGSNETTGDENTPTGRKKAKSKKSSEADKTNKKRKDIRKEGDAKVVKKKCKERAVLSASKKSKTAVQRRSKADGEESSVGGEGKTSAETQPLAVGGPGYSVMANGQPASEEVQSTVCKDTLAEYGKRPYMRLPPTAYLDEKYITMPKRRKEMSSLQASQKSPPRQQAKVTPAPPRQRCANCFVTFSSAEDLQGHLQLQKCSSLFGFDSDDEGNS